MKRKITVVSDLQILNRCTLYGGPFEEEVTVCDYCGERKPKDPCPSCGYPGKHRRMKPSLEEKDNKDAKDL